MRQSTKIAEASASRGGSIQIGTRWRGDRGRRRDHGSDGLKCQERREEIVGGRGLRSKAQGLHRERGDSGSHGGVWSERLPRHAGRHED